MDADDRGGWTQIFGGKASEPETSRPVKNAVFNYTTGIFRNFVEIFCYTKLESLAIVQCCLCDPTFNRFATNSTREGRTNGRTCDDSKYHASIAIALHGYKSNLKGF